MAELPRATAEQALVYDCLQGSADAWRTFVEDYGQTVYDAARFTLRRVLGSAHEEDAENVYQSVLLGLCDKSFHRLRLYQGRASLRTWLTAVTARFALNYIRSEKRKGSLRLARLEEGIEDVPERDHFAQASGDEQDRLFQAMAQLPSRERLLLQLFYFDGLSYRSISSILKVPVNSISPLMMRAKEALKKRVAAP